MHNLKELRNEMLEMLEHYASTKKGFEVLAVDWRIDDGHIDLVCLDGKQLVATEMLLRFTPEHCDLNANSKRYVQLGQRAACELAYGKCDSVRHDVACVRMHDNQRISLIYYTNVS